MPLAGTKLPSSHVAAVQTLADVHAVQTPPTRETSLPQPRHSPPVKYDEGPQSAAAQALDDEHSVQLPPLTDTALQPWHSAPPPL